MEKTVNRWRCLIRWRVRGWWIFAENCVRLTFSFFFTNLFSRVTDGAALHCLPDRSWLAQMTSRLHPPLAGCCLRNFTFARFERSVRQFHFGPGKRANWRQNLSGKQLKTNHRRLKWWNMQIQCAMKRSPITEIAMTSSRNWIWRKSR